MFLSTDARVPRVICDETASTSDEPLLPSFPKRTIPLENSTFSLPLRHTRCVPAGVCARVGPPRIDFLRLPFCDLGVGGHLEFMHSASSARAPISGPPLPSYLLRNVTTVKSLFCVYQPGFAKNERRASFRVNLACSSG